MWKIEKIVRKGDYNYAVVKDHPNATKYGYVLHHRIVVENHLGRLLNRDEIVHHLNHDKLDNRIDNLEILNAVKHSEEHGRQKRRLCLELKCPGCNQTFERFKSLTHLQKKARFTSCSRKCRGKISRDLALGRRTAELESAISENIVREYRKYSYDNPEETETTGSVETIRTPPETVKI